MKIRKNARKIREYGFQELDPGSVFTAAGETYMKTDSGLAVNLTTGSEVPFDNSAYLTLYPNATLDLGDAA